MNTSDKEKNTIIEYNKKSVLSRIFFSASWALGNISGGLTYGFASKNGQEQSKSIVNGAVPVSYGTFTLHQIFFGNVATLNEAGSIMMPAMLMTVLLDGAYSLATKSPSAFRSGQLEAKYGGIPYPPKENRNFYIKREQSLYDHRNNRPVRPKGSPPVKKF